MTDNDVLQYLKLKIKEGKEKDLEFEKKIMDYYERCAVAEKKLDEFREKHDEEISKIFDFRDDWLGMAYYWLRGYGENLECMKDNYYSHESFKKNGIHTTGAVSMKEIGEKLSIKPKEVKKHLESLEADKIIGKIRIMGGYAWYLL